MSMTALSATSSIAESVLIDFLSDKSGSLQQRNTLQTKQGRPEAEDGSNNANALTKSTKKDDCEGEYEEEKVKVETTITNKKSAEPSHTENPEMMVSGRVICSSCSVSRSIYCSECLSLLVEVPFDHNNWTFPTFDVDIILDDRRASSTGVQLKALWDCVSASVAKSRNNESEELKADKSEKTMSCSKMSVPVCRLFDVSNLGSSDVEEQIPTYKEDTENADSESTVVLFPSEESKPLSSIDTFKVKRLVLLDCKWTRSSIRWIEHLKHLPQVHLDSPPKESQFWRWHNAGDGMLSTIEAFYYCASDIFQRRKCWTEADQKILVNWFWIFRLQRNVIENKYARGEVKLYKPRPLGNPFSEETKAFQRSLRKKKNEGEEG